MEMTELCVLHAMFVWYAGSLQMNHGVYEDVYGKTQSRSNSLLVIANSDSW